MPKELRFQTKAKPDIHPPIPTSLSTRESCAMQAIADVHTSLGIAETMTYSTAAKGYDCAFCDKSTKIGTLVVLYI